MPEFTISKISDYGTAHPIVARTVIQTGELIKSFPLSDETREAINSISFDLERRLLACWEIAVKISSDVAAALDAQRKNAFQPQKDERFAEIPAVLGLESLAETFLYNSKLCLRDIARLFSPFTGNHFDENYKKFEEWARQRYGADDDLTKLIVADRTWIAQLIGMRNAVEHPNHRGGKLEIRNFRFHSKDGQQVLVPPTWWQGKAQPTLISVDMEVYVHNMLTFYEDLLSALLMKTNPTFPIGIAEIPEDERNPSMPVRLRIVLTTNLPGTAQ